jgi:hypothetical protein
MNTKNHNEHNGMVFLNNLRVLCVNSVPSVVKKRSKRLVAQ